MISFNTIPQSLPLSYLRFDKKVVIPKDSVRAWLSPLGFVVKDALDLLKVSNKKIGIIQHIIMPDHVHFILDIKERLDEDLGFVIGRLKREIYLEALKRNIIKPETKAIFEHGFNDLFLKKSVNLKTLINYIKENPYRLWLKQQNPTYFENLVNYNIKDIPCRLYGNISLLMHPFKKAVVVHRSFSPQELKRYTEIWKYHIYNGGVLVGAFISDKEKEFFNEAIENNSKIILISDKGYDSRQKPSGKLFYACSKGKLLIITPEEYLQRKRNIVGRKDFLLWNSIAESIAE